MKYLINVKKDVTINIRQETNSVYQNIYNEYIYHTIETGL